MHMVATEASLLADFPALPKASDCSSRLLSDAKAFYPQAEHVLSALATHVRYPISVSRRPTPHFRQENQTSSA